MKGKQGKQGRINLRLLTTAAGSLAVAAFLVSGQAAGQTPVDGDIDVPQGYQQWAKFVPTVDKSNGQIRELYINRKGETAEKGQVFPYGTVMVMEIFSSQVADGNPKLSADGRLIKDQLSKVFVMQKGAGWGAAQPEGTIDNGDWVYGAYLADGVTPATSDFSACRSCHLPLQSEDYVARYAEHFAD